MPVLFEKKAESLFLKALAAINRISPTYLSSLGFSCSPIVTSGPDPGNASSRRLQGQAFKLVAPAVGHGNLSSEQHSP